MSTDEIPERPVGANGDAVEATPTSPGGFPAPPPAPPLSPRTETPPHLRPFDPSLAAPRRTRAPDETTASWVARPALRVGKIAAALAVAAVAFAGVIVSKQFIDSPAQRVVETGVPPLQTPQPAAQAPAPDARADEDRRFRAAQGNLQLLKSYIAECTLCERKYEAQTQIADIERLARIAASSNADLCRQALDTQKTGWDMSPGYSDHVGEARKRSLAIADCRAAMGLPRSTQPEEPSPQVVLAAEEARFQAARGNLPLLRAYVAECKLCERKYEAQTQIADIERLARIAASSNADLCRQALDTQKTDWDTSPGYSDHVGEARRRSLAIADCRAAMGLPRSTQPEEPAPQVVLAAEEARFQVARGNLAALKAYLAECKLCARRPDAQKIVGELEKAAEIQNAPRADLCRQALDGSQREWDSSATYAAHVAEARRRGFSIGDCRTALGLTESAAQQPPTAVEATFSITNNTKKAIGVAFYEGGGNSTRLYPEAGRYFPVEANTSRIISVPCRSGQKVCYGAWKTGGALSPFWGLGHRGQESCKDCCTSCGATVRYALGDGDARKPAPTLTWVVTDKTSRNLGVAFYSQTRKRHAWPAWNKHWSLRGGENRYSIACRAGEKICYGAWDNSKINGSYWGAGLYGAKACKDCCHTCDGSVVSSTLVD